MRSALEHGGRWCKVVGFGALATAAVVVSSGCGGHVSDSSGTGGAGTTHHAGTAGATGTTGTAGSTGGGGSSTSSAGAGGTTTTVPEGSFQCGSAMCAKATQYCEESSGGPCCEPPSYACAELPDACKMAGATCDCFDRGDCPCGGTGPCAQGLSACQGSYEEGLLFSCFYQ